MRRGRGYSRAIENLREDRQEGAGIGGLIQDEDLKTKTKVPLLGDIPLIGHAFRTDKQTRSKTELYIIVTPHIVHRVGPTVQTAARERTYEMRPVSVPPAPPPAR